VPIASRPSLPFDAGKKMQTRRRRGPGNVRKVREKRKGGGAHGDLREKSLWQGKKESCSKARDSGGLMRGSSAGELLMQKNRRRYPRLKGRMNKPISLGRERASRAVLLRVTQGKKRPSRSVQRPTRGGGFDEAADSKRTDAKTYSSKRNERGDTGVRQLLGYRNPPRGG